MEVGKRKYWKGKQVKIEIIAGVIIYNMIIINKYITKEEIQSYYYNIIYIHVPMCWQSMTIYMMMVITSIVVITTKNKIGKEINKELAKIGKVVTVIGIVTGALWGKPTWDKYITWDIRIVGMVIMLITYMIIEKVNKEIITIIASINIGVIKYIVKWYNSIHQEASITINENKVHISIIIPMMTGYIGITIITGIIVMAKIKKEINRKWY